MTIIHSAKQMSVVSQRLRQNGKSIGFVPTMGALHAGHLSLIRQAARENNIVVVSIFVNPAQFGPREDFKRYPRPIKKDLALCRQAGVDFVFYPDAAGIYPQDFKTYVATRELGNALCGKSRPGHFQGVTTIVAKLFNFVQPDTAYFGQKDAQQAVIIKRMARDLNFPIEIKVLPIIREKDGLAISSRNVYLSAQERIDAVSLWQALKLAKKMYRAGIKDSHKIILKMRQLIEKKKTAKIDYIAVVDNGNLRPVKRIYRGCLIALAGWFGKTRLIDNIEI